jgi:hypothetical protein
VHDVDGVTPLVSFGPALVATSPAAVCEAGLHEAGCVVEDGSVRLRPGEIEGCVGQVPRRRSNPRDGVVVVRVCERARGGLGVLPCEEVTFGVRR